MGIKLYVLACIIMYFMALHDFVSSMRSDICRLPVCSIVHTNYIITLYHIIFTIYTHCTLSVSCYKSNGMKLAIHYLYVHFSLTDWEINRTFLLKIHESTLHIYLANLFQERENIFLILMIKQWGCKKKAKSIFKILCLFYVLFSMRAFKMKVLSS